MRRAGFPWRPRVPLADVDNATLSVATKLPAGLTINTVTGVITERSTR
jgi:hypothetical protein